MLLASWPPSRSEIGKVAPAIHPPADSPSALDREIIRGTASTLQRKMPPLLGIIDKTLLRHRFYEQVSPPPLAFRDGSRRRMRLKVGTIIARAHIDAALGSTQCRRRGAIGIRFIGIKSA